MLLWIVLTLIYVSLWLAFGMVLSVVARSAATSALIGFGTWVFLIILVAPIAGLLRIAWDTVGRIVTRVADRLDERRLERLVCIGVDEVSYRRGKVHGTVKLALVPR